MDRKGMKHVAEKAALREQATLRRTLREQFRRRRYTFLKSASAISTDCQADVYVVIFRQGKYFTFKSTSRPSWPPSQEEIVNMSTRL
jgi:hypothetical protein